MAKPQVFAGGGVVLAPGSTGAARGFVVVHRERYDDWSLPKGKIKRGESAAAAALREVEEETGLRCRLVDELPATRYRLPDGRLKEVRWWAMEVLVDSGFVANDEVDRRRWVDLETFRSIASYADEVLTVETWHARHRGG